MATEKAVAIGLALSGGGARAMAFHLGCLRALHDRGLLDRVGVISTVSGGSVIGASWAYSSEPFDAFDRRMVAVLRRGLQWDILREVVASPEGLKIAATLLVTGSLSFALWVIAFVARRALRWFRLPVSRMIEACDRVAERLPVWGSLTTALEAAIKRSLLGEVRVDEVKRAGLVTVVNACDLRTGTAFRFGSEGSGGWRYGAVVGRASTVAKAVAASAAFPILLPPLAETFEFEKGGTRSLETVLLTDGGVYDNLGVAVLEPGRADDSQFKFPVRYIISLNAGAGQLDGEDRHYWWFGRVASSFGAVHRKAQDAAYQRLHQYTEAGDIDGFGMVYLGQQDHRLPWRPSDLVPRARVRNYPTNFAPMSESDLEALTKRGEQLTHIIVERYLHKLTA